MAIALMAGLPNRYLRRVKDVVAMAAELAGWEFVYVVSSKGPSLQARDRKQIYAEAEKHGGPHVLGFSAERNREEVAAVIRRYFRFRWFDHSVLPALDTPNPAPFIATLVSALTEEQEWGGRIKPTSHTDALLLPECSFVCSGSHPQMWLRAEAYGSADSVPAAEKAIAAFGQKYSQRIQFQTYGQAPRSQYKWMDDRKIVFDESGARHGIAPVPRGWKYSYRAEEGFHYDVSRLNRSAFKIKDAEGETRSVANEGYINLEMHGFVR